MIQIETAPLRAVIHAPWRFDRIEVFGERANGEPVHLTILGEWLGQYESGPNLYELAGQVRRMIGPGRYGLRSCRKLGFWDSNQRLRLMHKMEQDRNYGAWARRTALVACH